MYAKFYGFDRLAFQLTPDPEFFYESAEHRRAMAHMTYGLHHAEGFIVITGDVGAGKTMLVDRLLSQIDAVLLSDGPDCDQPVERRRSVANGRRRLRSR